MYFACLSQPNFGSGYTYIEHSIALDEILKCLVFNLHVFIELEIVFSQKKTTHTNLDVKNFNTDIW